MKLAAIFGSRQQTKLVEHFLENPERIYNQAGLSRALNCSPSTVARLVESLIKEGVLKAEVVGGQMKVIGLNVESERAQALLDFAKRIRDL
jgi:DNA-binding Lrp family transcriptional regulator